MSSDTARRVRRALDGDRTVTVTRNFPLDDIRVLSRAEGGDGRTVTAYAAVFDDPTEIWDQDGHYLEQIHPNGFHATLQQRRNQVFCVYNHAKSLAGTPSDMWSVPIGKPLDMRTDHKGLLTVTRYNDDEASNRILAAIKSESLQGMSFTGVFLRSDPELTGPWSEYGPNKAGDLPLVTRMEIALLEYGPTPIPAYDNAQVVGVRARQQQEEGREQVTLVMTPEVIAAMRGQDDAARAAVTPQMATEIRPPLIHPDVKATPVHDTAPVLTPDDPTAAKWDTQQWENGMTFPADLDHMHSLFALYDTAGQYADGTFSKVAGHLPHHVVDADGHVGGHHPDAVRAALDTLPALPVTDEQRDAAREHLEAHMSVPAASEVLDVPSGDTLATNGGGSGTKVTVVPTSSSGRDEDEGQERAEADTWTLRLAEAGEYARALVEMLGPDSGDPGHGAAYARAATEFLSRAWDPDHDGDDDASPSGDTDHDYAGARGGDAPGDGSLPYGHVHYADNGLQKDGKKRYPLDTKEHAESAWGYINQEGNADKYSAEDLATVKAAIKTACKKFGVAISEDDDGGGKKSTSSSGRQPAAQDQQDRDGHADPGQEGTGPTETERTDAAPLTHPATDDDTSSSRSTPMDGPMKVAERTARVTAIQERMTAIHAAHPDGDLPAELDTEFRTLGEEMTRHQAAIKDASDRAAMIAAFGQARTQPESPAAAATETAVIPGLGDGDGEGQSRSKFTGAPQFMQQTDRSALYDLAEVKKSCRSYQDIPRAYRDRAMKILEVDGRGFPSVRYSPPGEPHLTKTLTMEDAQTRVATLLDTIDDEEGNLARRVIVTGNPTYERAFGKALSKLNMIGLDEAESRALALGVDAQGGYAVPFQLDPTVILTSNGAINPIRQLARVETIMGKEWDGVTSAGVTVTRASEGTEVGTGDAAFTQPSVRTTRVQGFVPFSVELDVSWGALRSQMTSLLMDAKDIEEATSFLTGSGTAPQCNGLITGLTGQYSIGGTNNGTASTVYTAGTATLAVGDLYALENAMPPRFRQQSAYMASRTTFNRFRQLFQALASAAFDSWVRPSAGQPATFNGYPAFEASPMAGTITSGSQVLVQGDYRQFLIVDRVGMGIELVPHLFGGTNRYPTGQRGILAIWFNNSQVLVPNAFRVLQTT